MCSPKCVQFTPYIFYSCLSYIVRALISAVTNLPNITKNFHDFPGLQIKIQTFPGLENEILKFQTFPGLSRHVWTLLSVTVKSIYNNLRSLHVRSYLWCFWFADSQHFSEVGVHGVVSFTFSFWGFNPVMYTTGLQLEKNPENIHLRLQNI